jgi:alkyl hydroperoxide reductase subunit F
MLDDAILDQLRAHFAGLSSEISFVVNPTEHPKQGELLELLGALATTSPKLRVVVEGPTTRGVQLEVIRDGGPTGVRFRGVPGGHEFTSLVLAVLHADGKGRRPDDAILDRVRRLAGPIDLRTYVSLSCTSCPDVVQALNLMALVHGDLRHTMIDGALAEDEVRSLGVQAVPAVYDGDHLLHVGKADFAGLLDALEERFGTREAEAAPALRRAYDVVVVGGGPAGAAAAIYSARKGLRTAIVAAKIGGQVEETRGIENLVGTPYTEGPKLTASLREHLAAYPVELLEHRKVERVVVGETKELHLKGGEILEAPAVIVATGARWRELGVPGEKEHLGRGVAFCPHCDGPFYKGRDVAVVGGGNSGVEAVIDLAGICSHVTLVEFQDELRADAVLVKNMRALKNVTVVTGARTTEIVGGPDGVTALRYQDRKTEALHDVPLAGVFVQIGLVPNSGFVKELVETNRAGEIVIDGHCRTSAPGIYAAGDVTTVPYKQIVIAVGEGAKAALAAFEDRIRAA